MNNRDANEIHDVLLIADAELELTDAIVDAFFADTSEYCLDDTEIMRERFVMRLLADLYRTPIKFSNERNTFSSWIEGARKKAILTREDIAKCLNKKASDIEEIETGAVLPWELNLSDAAHLIRLFKLHYTAVVELFYTSFAVENERNQMSVAARTTAKNNQSKEQTNLKKALEFLLVDETELIKVSDEVEDYLKSLKNVLESEGAIDLVT